MNEDPYSRRRMVNVDGRIVELEHYDLDPPYRFNSIVLGIAIGFLAGMFVAMWLNWPCPSELLRPYLECPDFPK